MTVPTFDDSISTYRYTATPAIKPTSRATTVPTIHAEKNVKVR